MAEMLGRKVFGEIFSFCLDNFGFVSIFVITKNLSTKSFTIQLSVIFLFYSLKNHDIYSIVLNEKKMEIDVCRKK